MCSHQHFRLYVHRASAVEGEGARQFKVWPFPTVVACFRQVQHLWAPGQVAPYSEFLSRVQVLAAINERHSSQQAAAASWHMSNARRRASHYKRGGGGSGAQYTCHTASIQHSSSLLSCSASQPVS